MDRAMRIHNSSSAFTRLLLISVCQFLLPPVMGFAEQMSGSYAVNLPISPGSYLARYVDITGAPANAIITSVEAKFDYIAYGVVQNNVSVRFNRGSDPGSSGGATMVAQGLPAASPPGGTYGYVSFSNWNGQAANASYYFRYAVAAVSPNTSTLNTIYVRVTYVVPPSPPNLSAPSDYGIFNRNQTGSITHQWSSVSGATAYWLYVFPTGDSAHPKCDRSVGNVTSYALSTSGWSNGEYTWLVRAGNAAGWVDSTSRRYIADTPPSAPSISAPANGSSFNLGSSTSFTWTGPAGVTVDRYNLRIVPGSDLNGSPATNSEPSGTSQTINFTAPPFAAGSHIWSVRAIKVTPSGYNHSTYETTIGWGAYAPTRTFTLQEAAFPAPILTSPVNGNDLDGPPYVFTWTGVSGAGAYNIKISTNSAFTTTITNDLNVAGTATSYSYNNFLKWGTTHYWQMRTLNSSGSQWGPWSQVQNFVPRQAIQAPPELISPADQSAVTDATLTFQWGTVPNVTSYEILVDNNSGFGSPELNKANYQNTTYTINNYLSDNVYYWKVRAKLSDGAYTAWSQTWQFTYHLPVLPAPVFVPLYRLYTNNQANGTRDHFYTANPVEKAEAISQKGYKDEGIECFVSDRNFLGGVPLYRLYWGEKNSHCFTTSEGEKDSRVLQGYVYEGIACFIYGNLGDALVPVHRLRQSLDTYHLFVTTEKGEYQNAINNLGYIEDAIIGYVAPKGIKDPVAHSRFQGNYGGVDLGSGALRGLNRLDLTIKGRGPALTFAHYYNSFNSNPYPMGRGWNHSLNSYTRESIDGNVYVYWGDSTISFFLKNGNAYEDKMGNNDQLALVNDGVNYGHNLTRKDQTVYKYRKINITPISGGFLQDNFRIVLISITDWRGNALTFNYETAYGTLQTVTNHLGRSFSMEYLEPTPQHVKRIYEMVDGLVKRQVSFSYNADGTLATITDACGKTTSYTYDADKYLTSIIYPKGNTVAFEYDEAKRVNSIKAENDPASRILYNPSPNKTEVTDPQNHVFQLSYNDFKLASARNLTETTPEIIEYNDSLNRSKPTRVVDKKGNQTQYQYDALGNVTRIANASGKVAIYTYNDKNNLLTATEFHAMGDSVIPTTYSYDTVGNRLRTITNPENEVTWLYYDAQHQITSVKDGRNITTYFGYDPNGNLVSKRDALNNITQYDNDYAGRTTHVRDAELKDTWYTYDGNDNLIKVTDHYGHEVDLVPDDNANPRSVSWVNDGVIASTDYGYDNKDRLNAISTPLGVSTFFTYYSTGEVNTRRDFNNITTSYYYDSNNRLQQMVYPDHSKTIGRDVNGTITSVSCQQGTTQLEYNELNLVRKYTDPYGNVVQYEYDNAGRLRTITYPGSKMVTYGYDQAGRLTTVQDWVGGITTYQYDDTGHITRSGRPNNTEALYSYDDANRLIGITDKKINGMVICSYSVTELDGVGNYKTLTAIEPLSPSATPANTAYGYDKRSNRLLTSGSTTYTYDDNGNRKASSEDGGKTYSWDFENMLTECVDSRTARTVRHYYDGLGNRIARVDGSQTTHYVLDLSGDMSRVLAETDENGNVVAYYVYGNGLISRISAANERRMYHYDYRGDTIALTDASGTITDAYAYDEYGRLLANQGNTPNAFRFVGRHGVMDEGGNLYLMRARFYDAGVGRFLSEDPVGFGGGDWNIYSYVGNNPLVNSDPNGLTSERVLRAFRSWVNTTDISYWEQESFLWSAEGDMYQAGINALNSIPLTPGAWKATASNSIKTFGLIYKPSRNIGDKVSLFLDAWSLFDNIADAKEALHSFSSHRLSHVINPKQYLSSIMNSDVTSAMGTTYRKLLIKPW